MSGFKAPKLVTIMAVTFGFGLIASGYLNVAQHQQAADVQRQLQGQVTDLKYQLAQDTKDGKVLGDTASPVPSSTATASSTPTPSQTPAASTAPKPTVQFVELGVGVTPSDPNLTDLTYTPENRNGLQVANLATQNLTSKYPLCKPGMSSLGQLVKRPKGKTGGTLVKSVGDYDYYYNPSTSSCATDAAGIAALKAARTALVETVLPTLTPIQ